MAEGGEGKVREGRRGKDRKGMEIREGEGEVGRNYH